MSVLRKKVNWSRLGLSTCQRSQQQQMDRDPSSCTRLYWGKKAFPGRLEMYLHKYNNDIPSSSCNRVVSMYTCYGMAHSVMSYVWWSRKSGDPFFLPSLHMQQIFVDRHTSLASLFSAVWFSFQFLTRSLISLKIPRVQGSMASNTHVRFS